MPLPGDVEQNLIKLAQLINSVDGRNYTQGGSSNFMEDIRSAFWKELEATEWIQGVRVLLEVALEILNLIVGGELVSIFLSSFNRRVLLANFFYLLFR